MSLYALSVRTPQKKVCIGVLEAKNIVAAAMQVGLQKWTHGEYRGENHHDSDHHRELVGQLKGMRTEKGTEFCLIQVSSDLQRILGVCRIYKKKQRKRNSA
ncbi:MAG TPA: hypothetical protein ACFYD4_09395 [Candidatus Wunengus sp. YC61]|uniref:hypothetical protein n=1 Tax=Candidatus Wunengus sp. YC61 TaxID=3367698 RepID=UPI0040273A92